MADVNAGTNLIGRDAELAALRSFLGDAAVDGATLLLTGEPGVGKTASLVAAAKMATTDGVRVAAGRVCQRTVWPIAERSKRAAAEA